ncbi:hypothetical protein [Vagococcus sp. WN89Y]|uniref:hypothetical protein n=1 Tax=Vagococcus sp. WN89Y TaxID=3457258 RepID=UPI003FCCD5B3
MEINSSLSGIKFAPAQFDTADNTVSDVTKSSAQAFADFAAQPGVMNTLLNGKSLMSDNQAVPALSLPVGGKLSAEQSQSIVAMSANVSAGDARDLEQVASTVSNALDSKLSQQQQNAEVAAQVAAPLQNGDANKSERIAATAAALFSAPATANPVSSKVGENSKASTEATATTAVSSATPVRSQAAVEGGTDITAAQGTGTGTGPVFSNLFGDARILELNNMLVSVLNKAENEFNKSSALASSRAMSSAIHAGDKGIAAAQQNMTGAITSGVMGMALQGGTTFANVRALNKESTSINTNLKNANKLDMGRMQNQSALKSSSDSLLSKGKQVDRNVEGLIDQPHVKSQIDASELRDAHNIKQMNTTRTRAVGDAANQANHSAQGMIQGAYGVEAAEENKQADIARADQAVNNEVADMHKQTSKKAADTQSAMQRVLENTLSNNNSAASSIAERMR